MKSKWDEAYSEEVPSELKRRVAGAVEPWLKENERGTTRKKNSPVRYWGPVAAISAAAAIVVVAHLAEKSPVVKEQPLAYDLQMIRDAELLLDLKVLESWKGPSESEKNGKWPKKST